MTNQVRFFEITSPNSKELTDFYSQVFGWTFLPPAGSMEYRVIQAESENQLTGAIGDPILPNQSWLTIHIAVDTIDAILEKVIEHRGRIKIPKFTTDTGFTLAYIEDCNGHTIGLMEHQPKE